MSSEFLGPSNPLNESCRVTLKWLALLAIHFRVELSDLEMQIYCGALEKCDPQALEISFQKCLHECEFLPKLKDIHDRMPETTSYFEPEPPMSTAAEDKAMWAHLMEENKEWIKNHPPDWENKRWTAEDGWLPVEESWRREAARESSKRRSDKPWHAPIKGPNIREGSGSNH